MATSCHDAPAAKDQARSEMKFGNEENRDGAESKSASQKKNRDHPFSA
jgi:hypothetical protein